ncbi:MAG: hypothetical protein EAZ91_12845 [Cytophagales bacterium]|nr:MAG: hypothetical protein EAZ91_12845 [Cytophagales bacterium]
MLEDTLELFREEDNASITTAQGVMLIDGWLQALENDPNVESIQAALNRLREELNSAHPDRDGVKTLLNTLADQVQNVAQGPSAEGQWTGGLQSMGVILREFSAQL